MGKGAEKTCVSNATGQMNHWEAEVEMRGGGREMRGGWESWQFFFFLSQCIANFLILFAIVSFIALYLNIWCIVKQMINIE